MSALIPRDTILLAVRRALEARAITRDDLMRLCGEQPTRRKRTAKVPRELIDRARYESERLGLHRDGLRFLVQSRGERFALMLVTRDGGIAPGRRLGEMFGGLDDMTRAAEQVVTNYLESLR